MKLDRAERRKVMALAQARHIDAVLVTELSRCGRSTTDLQATLKELEARRVSVVALNGMAFDLGTPHGRMIATVLAGIAEFRARVDSGTYPFGNCCGASAGQTAWTSTWAEAEIRSPRP